MHKRKILLLFLILLVFITCPIVQSQNYTVKIDDNVRAEQIKDMKWGMFICWSFSTFSGTERTKGLDKDATFFTATGCDTDQWCQVAKDAGMGYILFLTKHHDGFCLWDTKTTDKKVTNSPLGIDVLAKLRKSCDKYGIKLALYYSEGDFNWPGAVDGGRYGGSNPETKKAQLKELTTQYGPIELFWMDHAIGDGGLSHEETVKWIHLFQPNCFVGFNSGQAAGRLDLRERGKPGAIGDRNAVWKEHHFKEGYENFLVAEFTYPILPEHEGGADWFYSLPEHDNLCHPAEKIYKDYLGARKYENIFSINIGPDYDGRIREIDVKTLQRVGRYISGEIKLETIKSEPSKIDFNRDWTFAKSSAIWPADFNKEKKEMEQVILPHTWNADDMGPGLVDPYIGSAWYKKDFVAPKLLKGQCLIIEFEGVNNCHKVWINDGYAGGYDGGFLANRIDATDFLIDGTNTILVRVDNSYDIKAGMPQWIGWNRYGGITQPVWMYTREHAFVACAGIEIRTPEVCEDSASTTVKTHIEETRIGGADLELRYSLFSTAGALISTTAKRVKTSFFTNSVDVNLPAVINPELWSDKNPVLYTLKTEILEDGIVIDMQENRIGYRYFNFDANKGFTLNGEPTQLRGANIHMFFPGMGNALPERFYRNDIKLMKQMGCNYMRASHYPRTKEVLNACDELGIMVMEEQPYWHGSVRASGGEEAINVAVRLTKDLVRQHGNHPSVIAWNTVNEIMIAPPYKPGYGYFSEDDPERDRWKLTPGEYPYLLRHLQKMVEAFKEIDPDRPVAMVVGGQWEKNDLAGLTSITDIVAYNGGAMFLEDDFIGPKTGKNYEFKPDYYREIFPDRIHIMSEGILNHFTYARGDWEKEKEGWRWSAKYWNIINQRPWFCGGSMWCFTDYTYLSPMVVDRFTDNSGLSHHDLHGAVDRYRLPKEMFYFYEAMWSDHPVLHILGHWNYEPGSSQDVVVFSNCQEVELLLNGKSLGKGIPCNDDYPGIDNPPLIWKNISFKKGKLEARGIFGVREMADTRITAGKPSQITLSASNNLIADGRDISYIDIRICDTKGNLCYTVSDSLSIKVSGVASLAGKNLVPITGGLARVVICSNGETGTIKILAKGEGLESGELIVSAKLNERN